MKQLLIFGFYKPEDKINAHLLEHLIYYNKLFAGKKFKYVDIGSGYIRLLFRYQKIDKKKFQEDFYNINFSNEEIEKQKDIILSELFYKLKTESYEIIYQLLENNITNEKAYLKKIHLFANKPIGVLKKEVEKLMQEIAWVFVDKNINQKLICDSRKKMLTQESQINIKVKKYDLIRSEQINYIMPIKNVIEAVILNEVHIKFSDYLKEINQDCGTYKFSNGFYLTWNNRIINHFASYPTKKYNNQFNNLIFNSITNHNFEDDFFDDVFMAKLIKKTEAELKKRKWFDKAIELADFGELIGDNYQFEKKFNLENFVKNKIANSQIIISK